MKTSSWRKMKGFLLLYMTRLNFKNPHYVRKISEAFDLRYDQAQMTVAALFQNSHSLILLLLFMITWTVLPSQLTGRHSKIWRFLNLDSSMCLNTQYTPKFCWFFHCNRINFFSLRSWITYMKKSEHYTCSFYVAFYPYRMQISFAADQ